MKALREAYTFGFKDAQAGAWQIDTRYPRPVATDNRKVVLSDGTIVVGSETSDWKPPFGRALTPGDAILLADLWANPTLTTPVDDAI